MLGDFRQGLPDYIEKIISKKLDEQDTISFHTNPTNIDEDSGFNRVNNNGGTDTPVQNNRDKGSHNTDADQGSAVAGIPQKDTDSSIGELFRNRKRHDSKDDDDTPLQMSREILHQVNDNLGIQEAEGVAVDELLVEKIGHAYFESSADDTKLQKIMKENQHSSNLMTIKPPKRNPKIKSFLQFQNNTSFVMSNEKGLYSSQNFVVKIITIMSDIANSVLLASDNSPSGGPINHINKVKASMNGITLLGHVSVEFERKRKSNLRNIVQSGKQGQHYDNNRHSTARKFCNWRYVFLIKI